MAEIRKGDLIKMVGINDKGQLKVYISRRSSDYRKKQAAAKRARRKEH